MRDPSFANRVIRCSLIFGLLLSVLVEAADAQLKVVTTTPTYSTLAAELGGAHVSVHSLMHGNENIHQIIPTPSKMALMHDADLFIHSGLDLEMWVPQLLRGCRNRRIQPGQPGNVNAARAVKLKEVPQQVSRSQGEMHLYGNPHYQLDPINIILIARTIRNALKRADPSAVDEFDQNYAAFEQKMKTKLIEWLTKMRPYRGRQVVGYHNVLPYFTDRFGLKVIGFIEPKPGISPTATHTAELIDRMQKTGCRVILANTWANRATVRSIADRTGARVVVFPEWVGGMEGADDCFTLFDYVINNLVEAFQSASSQ